MRCATFHPWACTPKPRLDGIVWPVALTSAAWADCVEWADAIEARKGYTGQSESGRFWDVAWMLASSRFISV